MMSQLLQHLQRSSHGYLGKMSGVGSSVFLQSTSIWQRHFVTTSNLTRQAEEELQSNPYFNKYADKIAVSQKTSPDEYSSRLDNIQKRKEQLMQKPREEGKIFTLGSTPKPELPDDLKSAYTFNKQKMLDDIMKVDLIQNKSVDELKEIWHEYHKWKGSTVSAVIPAKTYELMHERAKEFSTFLFPLPRIQGYEFVVCQFAGHECHFTSLVNYQAYHENAPECLTIIHYPDLQKEKGVVFMRGEFDKNILDAKGAQCLANQVQMYYGQNHEKRLNLLRRFTVSPEEFRYIDLIAELESFSL